MIRQLMPGLKFTLLLTVLTGLAYPMLVTGLCQIFFRHQADGSLIARGGHVVGSTLIAQEFTRPEYFHSRPSAASFDATASAGSNLGPTSQKLADRVKATAEALRKENPDAAAPIPADLLTTSASGLDPHISPAAAEYQLPRVARARGLAPEQIHSLIAAATEQPDLGILGEARVNVLRLNLALDAYGSKR